MHIIIVTLRLFIYLGPRITNNNLILIFLIHHENIKPIIILGESILPGESKTIDMEIAKLHNIELIIVRRSKIDGVVRFFSRIHGDEINGVEIVKLITKKINKPKRNYHLYTVIHVWFP
jgi:hypothetical protein